jgi:phosphoribosyl-ATP pyrophosphohydrolase
MKLIEGRKTDPKEGSYTTYLFEKGIDKILKKVGEECTEVIIAGKGGDRAEAIFEITDLTYVDPDGNEIPDPETPSFPKGSTPTNTPAEKDHNGKFDFESAEFGEAIVPGLSTKPNELEYGNFIEIAEDPSGDKALKFVTVPSQKYNNSANFIADKTAPSGTNCQIFEFTINAVKADGDENFIQLQNELTETENKIQYARQFYNDDVNQYKNKLEMFPSSLVASFGHFERLPYFEAEASAKEAPHVEF